MINIKIFNDCLVLFPRNNALIKEISKQILLSENCNQANLSIILSNREYVSNLKKEYFKVNVFTDVIAFNLSDKNDCLDGEIYISIEDVLENAKLYSKSFDNEFKRVLVHGLLHLTGYNDDTVEQKENMKRLEDKYILLIKKEIISIS